MEKTYAGSISNKGAQEVKALHSVGTSSASKVKRGKDLRSGGGK